MDSTGCQEGGEDPGPKGIQFIQQLIVGRVTSLYKPVYPSSRRRLVVWSVCHNIYKRAISVPIGALVF